jgi:hypothetical protein
MFDPLDEWQLEGRYKRLKITAVYDERRKKLNRAKCTQSKTHCHQKEMQPGQ